MTDASTPRDPRAAEDPAAGDADPDVPDARWEQMVEDLRGLAAGVQRLAELRLDEARLRVRRLVAAVVIGLSLWPVLVAAVVLCVWHVLDGLAAGIGAALGARWLGSVAAGLAGLLLLLVALLVAQRTDDRRELARLRRKYGGPAA